MRQLVLALVGCALFMSLWQRESPARQCERLLRKALGHEGVDVTVSVDKSGQIAAAVLLERLAPEDLSAVRALAAGSLGIHPERGDRLELVVAGQPAPSGRGQSRRLFLQGALVATNSPYHLAIDGEGFFPVLMPDGTRGYTRDGCLRYDGHTRTLSTMSGHSLGITIPPDVCNLEITPEGEVKGTRLNGDGKPETIGQLKLVRFLYSGGLKACEGNIFVPTLDCGPSTEDIPGKNGLGVLAQGYLEKL